MECKPGVIQYNTLREFSLFGLVLVLVSLVEFGHWGKCGRRFELTSPFRFGSDNSLCSLVLAALANHVLGPLVPSNIMAMKSIDPFLMMIR